MHIVIIRGKNTEKPGRSGTSCARHALIQSDEPVGQRSAFARPTPLRRYAAGQASPLFFKKDRKSYWNDLVFYPSLQQNLADLCCIKVHHNLQNYADVENAERLSILTIVNNAQSSSKTAMLSPVQTIHTVSELTQTARLLLENHFPSVWVQGEVSNLSRPASGHLYFSLKDAKAQIRCALFQNRAGLFRDGLRSGQQVLARGRISLYEPRGDFQLIIEYFEEAGVGALRQAYDELRLRLEREGLFAPEHKQPLPRLPQRIGVITSPTGAALRDVLTTLRRRFPSLPVLLYPVPVQGAGAGAHIAQAIRQATEQRECDVLLLVRGGGSLEDLWAFNEEAVARAIHACSIPLVTGIGHETDMTIADFAADQRAATPTAAAELTSPDRREWLRQVRLLDERLARALRQHLESQGQRLNALAHRLERLHPRQRLRDRAQRLDELDQRLLVATRQRLQTDARRLQGLSAHLQALSPLATLNRGYAIARRYPDGEILRQASQVNMGDRVDILLGEGRLKCEIQAIFALDSTR